MALLETRNLVKQYANQLALNNVSFAIPSGSVFGLLGPNGAGKTSAIRIINQITAPDSGSVLLNGNPIKPLDMALIGYLPEERGLYKKMQVAEHILYLARLKGMNRYDAIAELRYWFKKFEIEGWQNKTIEELSKGMQQKVQFISTVIHKPKMLILDEPFSGFDPINAMVIKDEILALRDKGTTIILSTHNMASVEEICEEIALINKGAVLLSGKVSDIRKNHRINTLKIDLFSDVSPLEALNAYFPHKAYVTSKGHHHTIVVERAENQSNNEIIERILPLGSIVLVEEQLPTMNDIFIKTVTNN